jgi:predicted nucleic acid-binding protein
MTVVADTSALVSLGCATDPSVLDILISRFEVAVPEVVVAELEEVAAYEDDQARAVRRVLDRKDEIEIHRVALDDDLPLDDGENGAVILANERDASMLLCDEFNKIGLVHASLNDVKLVTTPKLLLGLEAKDLLSTTEVETVLAEIGDVRSWDGNSYVERVRNRL